MTKISRRDFLKLSGVSLGSMAFSPAVQNLQGFDDREFVRVATDSVSIYSQPNDESRIVSTRYRDELLNIYGEVTGDGPAHNPIWYRVWGGYVHRARLVKVKYLYNQILPALEEGQPRLVDVTVPFTEPWRYTRIYNWQKLGFRLYYGSVHWIDAIEEGPLGEKWYRVYDDLTGFPYNVNPLHVRPIPLDTLAPISPEVPLEKKRIDINLTTQTLTAFEYDTPVLKTTIASGILGGPVGADGLPTRTPEGEFRVIDKMPAKHMGNGNLFADFKDYELPGVPWTLFFTAQGHAIHGTYWHNNYGVPMSRGCVNMRTEEAKWLFLWSSPPHEIGRTVNRGFGTLLQIHY